MALTALTMHAFGSFGLFPAAFSCFQCFTIEHWKVKLKPQFFHAQKKVGQVSHCSCRHRPCQQWKFTTIQTCNVFFHILQPHKQNLTWLFPTVAKDKADKVNFAKRYWAQYMHLCRSCNGLSQTDGDESKCAETTAMAFSICNCYRYPNSA